MRSAQRFGERLRLQLPDIDGEEAREWLGSRLFRDQPGRWPATTDTALRSTAY